MAGDRLADAKLMGANLREANLSVTVLWGTKLDDTPRRSGAVLDDVMVSAIGVASEFDYGRQEIVEIEDGFAVIRTCEYANCYGMPNLGKNYVLMRQALLQGR